MTGAVRRISRFRIAAQPFSPLDVFSPQSSECLTLTATSGEPAEGFPIREFMQPAPGSLDNDCYLPDRTSRPCLPASP
ncbi:MAG: hypothetical protein DWH78_09480 [Planctomycetota bacterium]|nr:MAG: hypothetical protein DWH78_09480 [Planctomycetota bacterium]